MSSKEKKPDTKTQDKAPDAAEGEEPKKLSLKERLAAITAKLSGLASQASVAAADSKGLQSFKGGLLYLLTGMFSKDGKTRLTTVIFWTSVILLLVVGKTAARKFSEVRHFQKYGMNEAQLANKQRLEALALAERERKANVIQTTLGDFNFELVPEPGHSSKRGILNNAEIEIVVVCESREICDTILKRITEARNEITNALTPLGREELLSRDGKKRVKRTVVERLNKWLGQDGLVIDIFFNRFVIT